MKINPLEFPLIQIYIDGTEYKIREKSIIKKLGIGNNQHQICTQRLLHVYTHSSLCNDLTGARADGTCTCFSFYWYVGSDTANFNKS